MSAEDGFAGKVVCAVSDVQTVMEVKKDELVDKAVSMKGRGYRLVAITCTCREALEITYSFDKEYDFVCYRIHIGKEEEILSISHVFYSAFLYENEMKDLFGVRIKDISLDYNGNLYRVAEKAPFVSETKEPEEF